MKSLIGIGAILFLAVVFIFAPFALIAALNVFGATYWPTHMLPYTIETWLASLIALSILKPDVSVKLKK